MATRALLGSIQTDAAGNQVLTSTYNHYDGYPENLGVGLNNFYDQTDAAIKISNQGYISYLDPETGDFIRTFLEEYKKEKKISVLLASHNMSEVKRLCNSVLMMKDGIIVDSGKPNDLVKKYGRKNLEEVFL